MNNRSGGTHALPTNREFATRQEVALVVVEGPEQGRRLVLQNEVTRVGKDPSCDLVLPDVTVSRCHFIVRRENEGYLLVDQQSTNGTMVNDMKAREVFLQPGARVTAGRVAMVFQSVHVAAPAPLSEQTQFGGLVGSSPPMRAVFGVLERVAQTNATVLLFGETGTGKGATARAIHSHSSRKNRPLIVVDCGAISPTLIESELFGREKGAYTGATEARAGACEEANRGTLFLDECDDLPLELQSKLLRVLEEREVRRLGSVRPIKLDIRIIAATKVDLRQAVAEGKFREDLYFRLSVVQLALPPLRDHREDLPLLCQTFWDQNEMEQQDNVWHRLSPALREQLEAYHWPGNVRELRNVLERIRYMGAPGELGFHPGPAEPQAPDNDASGTWGIDYERPFKEVKDKIIETFEKEYLARLLERANGNIAGAARTAGLNRKYFYDLLRKHGLHGQ
jgi:DNA-binding NtrC family response regulator